MDFFDTAIAYQLGTSEQYVGRALRDMAKRDHVVVATKFLPRTDEEILQGIGGHQHVLNSIDLSLQHLDMDYVDLYIYHIWDYKTPAEEILEGMNEVVRMGKAVKWVDLSVNRLGHIQRICLPTSEDECAGRETRLGKVHQRAKPLQPYYA